MSAAISGRAVPAAALSVIAFIALGVWTPATAAAWTPPQPTYQSGDYGHGRIFSVLPPGENGLVNATDLAQFEASGTRPPGSQDQLGKYANLLYGYPGLTDAGLSGYYNEESFGIPAGQITATETPSSTENVVIYRDTHRVPHIYGADLQSLSFGAGDLAGYSSAQGSTQ